MKKVYILSLMFLALINLNAQVTIDLSTIDATYTTTFEDELVLDLTTTVSAHSAPSVSFDSPFYGESFTQAEISFDVYNYGNLAFLGTLLSIHQFNESSESIGRMYFSNGSYLGVNLNGIFGGDTHWMDINVNYWSIGTDFLGSSTWKNVKLVFSTSGYALYVDDVLAFDQDNSTVPQGSGGELAYSHITDFLANAQTLMFGTGSWWSDNYDSEGNYYDAQNSYMKNITLSFSTPTAIGDPATIENAIVVNTEFYSISGVKASNNYQALNSGIYIKVETLSNGKTKATKIFKGQE